MGLTNKFNSYKYKYKSKSNFTKKNKLKIQSGGNNNYDEKYKNTPYIPKSNFINEMKSNFPKFLEKSKSNSLNISLSDLFIMNINIKNNKKISINKTLNQNPNMKLDDLIQNIYYTLSKSIFIDNNILTNEKFIISRIKDQIGIDVVRSNLYINGNLDNKQDYMTNSNDTKEKVDMADIYYEKLIQNFKSVNLPVNYNLINKICLLTTQNLSNFLSDTINMYINSLIKPEMALIYNVNKITKTLIISKTKIYFILTQKSDLLVTKNQEWQTDNICGNLYFKFKVDILNNTYIMKNLQLNLNTNYIPCSPPKKINEISDDDNNNESNNTNKNYINKDLIPLFVSVAGVTTYPFILGAL
jgi:hypothetical protein